MESSVNYHQLAFFWRILGALAVTSALQKTIAQCCTFSIATFLI